MNENYIPNTFFEFERWQSNIDLEIINKNLEELREKLANFDLPEDYYFRRGEI